MAAVPQNNPLIGSGPSGTSGTGGAGKGTGTPNPYPDGPDTPGYSNNNNKGQGYFNSYLGTFDGGGNPNTNFNPNIGTFANATKFTYGVGGNTFVNGVAAMNNADYSQWDWEELFYQILGVRLPDRNEILNGRWTGIQINSKGTNGVFYIYGVTWGTEQGVSGNDALIYLQPTLQTQGGPWDVYLNGPYQALWDPSSGFSPNKNLELQASTFMPPALALSAVENMFLNSASTLSDMSLHLATDANTFRGKAGGAFAQLIDDLYQQTNSSWSEMAGANPPTTYYSTMIMDCAQAAAEFLSALWNAYADWSNMMQHSPLGAILMTLVNGGVVNAIQRNGKTVFEANPSLDPNDSSFGMLTTNAAWMKIESRAKALWSEAIENALDYPSQTAFAKLVSSYETAGNRIRPLKPKTVQPISQPNTTVGPNTGGGGLANIGNYLKDLGQGSDDNFNSLFHYLPNLAGGVAKDSSDNFNSLFHALPNLNNGTNSDFNSLFHALPNVGAGAASGIAGLDSGLNSLAKGTAGGFNSLAGGLGSQKLSAASMPNASAMPQASMPVQPNLSASGMTSDQLTPTATMPTPMGALSQPASSDLQDALNGTDQTQGALNQAMASGQMPSSGPLKDAVAGAMADNAQTQQALNQALDSGNPADLQTAMADNNKTQTALNQALASGDLPSTGPVAADLRNALAGTSRTRAALQKAMQADDAPAVSSLHGALADNSQTRAALDQAMASGQVPGAGTLHTAIQAALADTGKTHSALTSALAAGAPSASQLRTALADNNQTRAALQRALNSGQVPATGALHTTLRNALADTSRTGAAINKALVASAPGGAALQRAMTSDGALQGALHRAMASGQVPRVGTLHDAVQSAMESGGKLQNSLNQALAGGGASTQAIQRAQADNQALQNALHRALASGQVPKTGPMHADLQNALADSQRTGSALNQALASRGIAAEPGAGVLAGGPSALTGGLSGLGSKPLISATGTPSGIGSGGLGAGGISSGSGGLSSGVGSGVGSGLGGTPPLASGSGVAAPVSSGAFVPPTTGSGAPAASGAAAESDGGFPMYMPMAGGMGGGMGGMGGGGGQSQERERSTWLAEDEDVWGTEPDVAPQVLGRDFADDDDELNDYEGSGEDSAARLAQARLYGR